MADRHGGDLVAATVIVRIIDQRCRLLNLHLRAKQAGDEPRTFVIRPTG